MNDPRYNVHPLLQAPLLAAALALSAPCLPAAVPPLVGYQAQLKVAGVPFTGTGQFKFAVVDRPTGASLWSNDGTSVNGAPPAALVTLQVKDGLFNVLLGDPTLANMLPLNPGVFYNHPDTLLRAWFNDGANGWTQLADRPLASAPYAMSVEIPSGSITWKEIDINTVQPTNMAAINAPQAGRFLRYETNDRFSWADVSTVNNAWASANNGIYYNGGNVGIGTDTPRAQLHTLNPVGSATHLIETGGGENAWTKTIFRNGAGEWHIGTSHLFNENQFYIDRPDHPGIEFFVQPDGRVGIGAYELGAKLHIYEAGDSVSQRIETGGGLNAWTKLEFRNGNGQWNVGTSRGFHTDGFYFHREGSGVHAFEIQPNGDAFVQGTLTCKVLTITGGADLAEPFAIKEDRIEAGSVVVIDDEHPGQLKRSTQAYDTRVAGIVSGANGISPGIALKQEGALDQGKHVALTGRVYVRADASHGAIKPGDLLTTSDMPGHAMKVADHARAQGAILGKAMSSLSDGTGMVLVLVTLQ